MYGFIYVLTIMLIIDNRIIPSRLFPLFWFTVMVFLSLSIRWTMIQSGQALGDGDLSGYVFNMGRADATSYHLREPIFWFGTRYLYKVIGNPGLVFVVTDVILFLTFYKSVSLFQTFFPKQINFYNVKYLYFGAFLIYPYLTGMHNHYRQILAVTSAMCAFGLAEKKLGKALFVYLISVLTHNATILLSPILLLAHKRNTFSYLMVAAVLTIIFFLFAPSVYFYEVIRRFFEVGMRDVFDTRTGIYFYLLLFTTFFVIFLEYNFKGKVQYLFIKVVISLTAIYFFSYWFFPSQGASRVFFMALTLLYSLIGLYIEVKFKSGRLVRLFYFHLSLVPLLGLRGDGLIYDFG